jgi:NTP pyrophosphatase (non-canonical NTP hydrolase)
MSDIKNLTRKIIKFRDDRNWRQFHNPKDLAISLSLEAAELLEHFQWKNIAEINEHIKKEKKEIAEELADILYWVLLISHDLKIDILKASELKLLKNISKYPKKKAINRHTKYNKL